jgi:hypothetical protein
MPISFIDKTSSPIDLDGRLKGSRPLGVPPLGRGAKGDYAGIARQRQMRRGHGFLGHPGRLKKVKKTVAFRYLLDYFVTTRNY